MKEYSFNNYSKRLFESRLQLNNHKSKNIFFQQSRDNIKNYGKFSFITNVEKPIISEIILNKPNNAYSNINSSSSSNSTSINNNFSSNNGRINGSNNIFFKNKLLTFNKYSKNSRNNSKEKSYFLIKNITYHPFINKVKCKSNSNFAINSDSTKIQSNSQKDKNNDEKKKHRLISIYIDNSFNKKNNLKTLLYTNKCFPYKVDNKEKTLDLEKHHKKYSLPTKIKNKKNSKRNEHIKRKYKYTKKAQNQKVKKGIIYKCNSNDNYIRRNLNINTFHIKSSKEKINIKNIPKTINIKLLFSKGKMNKKPTSKNSKNKRHSIRYNLKCNIFDFSRSLIDLTLKKNKDENINKNDKIAPILKIDNVNSKRNMENSFLSSYSVKKKEIESSKSSNVGGILTIKEIKDIIIYNDMNNVKKKQNFLFFFDDRANFFLKNNFTLEKLFFGKNENLNEEGKSS